MLRFVWMLGLGLWAALPARAETPVVPLTLVFDAPPECGSAAAIEAELARIVAREGVVLSPIEAEAHVAHDRAEGLYVGTLRTRHDGEIGERTLEARTCPTLVRSLTLVLAVTFGSGSPLFPEPAPAEPEPLPEPALEPAPVRAPAPVSRPARVVVPAARLRMSILLGPALWVALTPRPAGVLALGGELERSFWRAGVRALGLRSLEHQRAGTKSRYDALGLALEGCAQRVRHELAHALCLDATSLALRGRGRSPRIEDGSAVAPWYALGAALGLGFPASSWLRVRAEAGLDVSLVRPRFVIDGLGQVQRVPLLVPRVGLMLLLSPF